MHGKGTHSVFICVVHLRPRLTTMVVMLCGLVSICHYMVFSHVGSHPTGNEALTWMIQERGTPMAKNITLEDKVIETVFTDIGDLANLIEDSTESTIDTTMMPVATSLPCMTVTGAVGC